MLIIIAAHIPIFTLQRHEGRIFAPMAYSVVSALVGALILSLTLVPLLCAVMLKKNLPEEENVLVRARKRLYEPALAWALGTARSTVIGVARGARSPASLALVPQLGTEFLPELNEGAIWINVTLPTSVSVTEAQDDDRKGARRHPQRSGGGERHLEVGRPEDGTDPKLINMAEFLVDLKPESRVAARRRQAPHAATRWTPEIVKIPGIEPSFSQPIRDNVLESISQIDGQIVIKVFGDDLDVLRDEALEVLEAGAGTCRAWRAPSSTAWASCRRSRCRVDRARAARYGLNVADVRT